MAKFCPFNNNGECSTDCGLFVATDDMNELVSARLGSLGVVDRANNGSCALKMLAMSGSRYIFENTTTKRS